MVISVFPAWHVAALVAGAITLAGAGAWGAKPTPRPVVLDHVRRVVLDPGHGGDNTGALGTAGIREKDLTLDVARAMRAWLVAHSNVEVLLTRDRDVAVELRQRPRLANDWKADALVSIHANAHPLGEARGMEVFFLAADASAEAARELVAREEGGVAPAADGARAWSVGGIKADLALAAAHARAQAFALAFGDALKAVRKKARFRGVRQAPFGVLKEATMPAVVLEIGFISHAEEGPELVDPGTQEQFARALLRALTDLDRRLGRERKAAAKKVR